MRMRFSKKEAKFGTGAFNHQLLLNFITVIVLFGLGFVMPWLRKREQHRESMELN